MRPQIKKILKIIYFIIFTAILMLASFTLVNETFAYWLGSVKEAKKEEVEKVKVGEGLESVAYISPVLMEPNIQGEKLVPSNREGVASNDGSVGVISKRYNLNWGYKNSNIDKDLNINIAINDLGLYDKYIFSKNKDLEKSKVEPLKANYESLIKINIEVGYLVNDKEVFYDKKEFSFNHNETSDFYNRHEEIEVSLPVNKVDNPNTPNIENATPYFKITFLIKDLPKKINYLDYAISNGFTLDPNITEDKAFDLVYQDFFKTLTDSFIGYNGKFTLLVANTKEVWANVILTNNEINFHTPVNFGRWLIGERVTLVEDYEIKLDRDVKKGEIIIVDKDGKSETFIITEDLKKGDTVDFSEPTIRWNKMIFANSSQEYDRHKYYELYDVVKYVLDGKTYFLRYESGDPHRPNALLATKTLNDETVKRLVDGGYSGFDYWNIITPAKTKCSCAYLWDRYHIYSLGDIVSQTKDRENYTFYISISDENVMANPINNNIIWRKLDDIFNINKTIDTYSESFNYEKGAIVKHFNDETQKYDFYISVAGDNIENNINKRLLDIKWWRKIEFPENYEVKFKDD